MPDPLQALLAADAVPTAALPPTSRYVAVGVDTLDRGDGSPPVPYFRRRFCPAPERLALLQLVSVVAGDRRDTLAARHLGDVELWWRLADANGVVDPRALTAEPGRHVRITLASDVSGESGG